MYFITLTLTQTFLFLLLFTGSLLTISNCCVASVTSEQQHKQDLRRIYKREYDSRIHHFLPECIAPFYQNALRLLPECIAPFYQNALRPLPECIARQTTREVVTPLCCRPFSRGLKLIKVRYGLLWFTCCKAMWARSCLPFTTLAVVVNAELSGRLIVAS